MKVYLFRSSYPRNEIYFLNRGGAEALAGAALPIAS